MITNLKELMRDFSTEDHCRQFLIRQRWNGTPVCPYCTSTKSYVIEGGKRFKCGNSECYKKYSVTVGTIFQSSNIPLTSWLPAMYILSAHKKGISSVQLAKDLGVTQKTAWFMMHRIRESLKEKNSTLLEGTVEIDETYMSRKYSSDYKAISPEDSAKMETVHKKHNKGAVIGLKQRDGKLIVKAAPTASAQEIGNVVKDNVSVDALIMSDESLKYNKSLVEYDRLTVNHSQKEWVRGIAHTNGIEGFWGLMKRGIYGIYHQISYKHLQRYCDEFSYRYNSRNLKDGARFYAATLRVEGRLKYLTLIQKDKDGNSTQKAN